MARTCLGRNRGTPTTAVRRTGGGGFGVRRMCQDTRGAVYVEFLLCFIPVFMMFLAMVQMGLMYAAGLVVQRSASVAARAAIVVIDDDERRYDEETRMQLRQSGGSGTSSGEGEVLGFLRNRGLPAGSSGGGSAVADSSGARLAAIRLAAGIPLMAVAPTPAAVVLTRSQQNVLAAIGDPESGLSMPASRAVFALLYNRGAMAVSFPSAYRGEGRMDQLRSGISFAAPDLHRDPPTPVTVRVSYLFHCAVPLVNRLMCSSAMYIAAGANAEAIEQGLSSIISGGGLSLDALARAMEMRDRLIRHETAETPQLQDMRDMDATTALAAVLAISSLAGGPAPRFKIIAGEASLPIQYANYDYRTGLPF